MKTNKDSCFLGYRYFLVLLLVCIPISVGSSASAPNHSRINSETIDFAVFQKALENSEDIKAASIGDSIFEQMEQKYKDNAGFVTPKSKLTAADSLTKRMIFELKKATNRQMLSVADELFDKKDNKNNPLLITPAKSFYETSTELFSKQIRTDEFGDNEKTFLAQYYDLKLRILITAIAKAGQSLAIAKPTFKGTHDYVLVLPLLHASSKNLFNVNILPRWMRQPEQLNIFSDSCLLHFGLPFHAMMIAKQSAQIQEIPFSEVDFYRSEAQKCRESHHHIAANCLRKAIDCVADGDPNMAVSLQFEVVQLWLDSKNYALAASQARKIFETYPNHKESGKAIWLYYYTLLRGGNADEILAHIDKALGDKRCETYKVKLMYIKWWSLHRKQDETARVEILEYEMLKQYGNDPIVAPILLFRAVNILAHQDYNGAYELLTQLVEKFPSTKSAAQAKRVLDRLEVMKGAK